MEICYFCSLVPRHDAKPFLCSLCLCDEPFFVYLFSDFDLFLLSFLLDVQARRMPEQERLDDAIGILRNHTEVVCLSVSSSLSYLLFYWRRFQFVCFALIDGIEF